MNGTTSKVIELFFKNGIWAVCFAVICLVLYFDYLKPTNKRNEDFTKSLIQNSKVVSENTTAVKDGIKDMQNTLNHFTKNVEDEDHPKQTELLEAIKDDTLYIRDRVD